MLDWWALACALHRLASTISMMAVLLIGAYLVTYGKLRIGDIIAFTGFASLLISRLDQISAFANQVFDAACQARGLLPARGFLRGSATSRMAPRDLGNVTGHVRFEDVGFAFPNSGHGVSDISFEVQAGETVAIVGPTGAGKTTLINLLQRVFDPTQGRILIDGIDTRTVTAQVAAPVDRHRVPGCRRCSTASIEREHPHRLRRRELRRGACRRQRLPPRTTSS